MAGINFRKDRTKGIMNNFESTNRQKHVNRKYPYRVQIGKGIRLKAEKNTRKN
jgi:hypothetical protein